MKFLTKINRNYFLLLISILFFASIGGYFIVKIIILNEARETLLEREILIRNHLAETGEVPNIYPIIEVNKIDSKILEAPIFKEIKIKDEFENEFEPYLEYSNQVKIKNSWYFIKLRQSTFESEDLIIILALTLSILLLSSFGVLFFISKKMNKTVWSDFEQNLHEIENFNFIENKKLNLFNSHIDEFDRLNKVVIQLTEKLKSDYLLLKEFTENASHEIQTPLSVVLLNLEEVLQQDLNKETFKKVVSSINALKRLSTLNQSLILLTKIENKQFKAEKILSFNDIIKQKVMEFAPLFETKKLTVKFKSERDFLIKMNEHLAELLIINLLSNAVNHNLSGGNIKISIKEKELKICNTGEANSLTEDNIFNRFAKGNSKSLGLGLAIVKNICDTHNLEIHYLKNELHCFIINPKF
jgi:signal transduction histidine kinase